MKRLNPSTALHAMFAGRSIFQNMAGISITYNFAFHRLNYPMMHVYALTETPRNAIYQSNELTSVTALEYSLHLVCVVPEDHLTNNVYCDHSPRSTLFIIHRNSAHQKELHRFYIPVYLP